MNWQLFSIIFTIASGVMMGILMTIALVMGFDKGLHVMGSLAIGFILSIPVAWVISRKMQSLGMAKSP